MIGITLQDTVKLPDGSFCRGVKVYHAPLGCRRGNDTGTHALNAPWNVHIPKLLPLCPSFVLFLVVVVEYRQRLPFCTFYVACLRVMMIAALPQWHHAEHLVPDADTTTIVSSVREGAAGIVTNAQGSHELHQQGEAHVIGSGGSNDGDRFRSSLLEKYTFRETIRTVIEEDQLPDLPEFLDSIGLGGKLEVRTCYGGNSG